MKHRILLFFVLVIKAELSRITCSLEELAVILLSANDMFFIQSVNKYIIESIPRYCHVCIIFIIIRLHYAVWKHLIIRNSCG